MEFFSHSEVTTTFLPFWLGLRGAFFSSFFVHCRMATPSLTWPNVTPLEAHLRPPPHHMNFSTSIWYLCSEFYILIHCEIEFSPEWHPTFNRGHNNGFWPFFGHFAILARIEGAMCSYCACSRLRDMESRSFLVERLSYTIFYAAELLRNGA